MATSVEPSEGSFTWKIEGFSKLPEEDKLSETFEIGGYKWYLVMHPRFKEKGKDHLSLSLKVADPVSEGWTITASPTLIVHHQSDPEKSVREEFGSLDLLTESKEWGFADFMKLDDLHDAQKKFLVDDSITVEVQVKVKPDLLERFTKNDHSWSLCLQFDGLMAKPESPKAKEDPKQKDWVSVKEGAKQQSLTSLYADVGFMNAHSKLIKDMTEAMNLSAAGEKDKNVISIPKEFCPGRCSLVDVQCALGHLYFPREFPLKKYDSSMHKLLHVADYFQIRHLTLDLEDCLLDHIKEKLEANASDMNPFMEWMLWSESFDLKRCWSALKEGLLRNNAMITTIINHKNFQQLSLQSQIDIMNGCCTTLLLSESSVTKKYISMKEKYTLMEEEYTPMKEEYSKLKKETTIKCQYCNKEKKAHRIRCCGYDSPYR